MKEKVKNRDTKIGKLRIKAQYLTYLIDLVFQYIFQMFPLTHTVI